MNVRNFNVTLGLFIFLGLSALGYQLSAAAIQYKEYERTVTAKGLSEREQPADVVIWPIQFVVADNQLGQLYQQIEQNVTKIYQFLEAGQISTSEITLASPVINDKTAESYGNNNDIKYRYSATQTVTVYSKNVRAIRALMSKLSSLGKQGIVLKDTKYQTEYIFTQLNKIKPSMIAEATTNARAVAEKFAKDSKSRLGKIKKASQGQFTIYARDNNNPNIKKVRVVSTVEYYLSD